MVIAKMILPHLIKLPGDNRAGKHESTPANSCILTYLVKNSWVELLCLSFLLFDHSVLLSLGSRRPRERPVITN